MALYRLRISTKAKIALAKNAFQATKLFTKIKGQDYRNIKCTRKGINWHLDLEEGIDFYVYLFGRYEKSSYEVMDEMVSKGDTVIDIGANVGAHTLPLTELVGDTGQVIAIEPTNWAFHKLMRNINLNPQLKNSVTPIQALMNEESNAENMPTELYSSWSFDEKKAKHEILRGSLNSTSDASIFSLDDLVENLKLKKIDFIKMDVDGFECKVLRGAHKTISKFKPKMLLEFCPYLLTAGKGTLQEYVTFLKDHGYKLYEESSRKPLSMNWKELDNYIPAQGAINAIALRD